MMVCGIMVRGQDLVHITSAMGTCSRDHGGTMSCMARSGHFFSFHSYVHFGILQLEASRVSKAVDTIDYT